ncbi:efflux RND transporter permease subunit, partial [Candidatus Gracilibacteria bacterium]|nr:efflux RND transporter permease subunit [Candidatus Gracilibacteria bacterium]
MEKETHTTDSLYLDKLTYSKKDGKTWLNFFIKKFRITVLIVIGILIWGVISALALPQESTPEVKIPFGIVTVTMPGASPEDMEELIVKKIESRVTNLSGVKQVSSTASNSFAVTTVEFNADEDLKDAIRRLRDAATAAKNDLPADASDPNVNEVSFSSMPVWTMVITGPYDSFTLRKYAELLQDELKKLPGASEVNLNGGDIYEMHVAYDPAKLEHYGLSMDQLNNLIRANNFSIPLGTVKISDYDYTIRASGKVEKVKDLREMPLVTMNDQIIKLKDVATVMEIAQDRSVINTFSSQGKPAENSISINIVKKTGSSIIELIDSGKVTIEKMSSEVFPKDLKIATITDMSQEIRKNLDQLVRDGILTVVLVF